MYPDSDTPQQAPPGGGFLSGARRSIAMGALAAALLVVGGSAVALAADPAASPDPSATAQPADGGTTAPSTATPGSTAPGTGHPAHGDCPAKDGSGTGTDAQRGHDDPVARRDDAGAERRPLGRLGRTKPRPSNPAAGAIEPCGWRYISGIVSETRTTAPPWSTGQPFERATAASSESALRTV